MITIKCMRFLFKAPAMPTPTEALPGRPDPIDIPERHYVNDARLAPPWPDGTRTAVFGFGCFWGAEKTFWQTPGVISTAVGYAGGSTPNPTYGEVCSGKTGHAEVVLVAYDPARVSYEELLRVFWEDHDPTQGMRQGNDVGTQYRSVILVGNEAERRIAEASRAAYAERLKAAGFGDDHDRDRRRRARRRSTTPRTTTSSTWRRTRGPAYCPDHATGVKLPDDFAIPVTPLQYVD